MTEPPRPSASIRGTAASVQRYTAVRLRSIVFCHSAGSSSRSGVRTGEPPALLTHVSSEPNSFMATSANASTSSRLVTSVVTAMARPPAARISAATRSISSVRRAAHTTAAPASASTAAMPSPMPRPAPVTTAVLPCMSYRSCAIPMMCSLVVQVVVQLSCSCRAVGRVYQLGLTSTLVCSLVPLARSASAAPTPSRLAVEVCSGSTCTRPSAIIPIAISNSS